MLCIGSRSNSSLRIENPASLFSTKSPLLRPESAIPLVSNAILFSERIAIETDFETAVLDIVRNNWISICDYRAVRMKHPSLNS